MSRGALAGLTGRYAHLRTALLASTAVICLIAAAGGVAAADFTWTGAATDDYGLRFNWDPLTSPPTQSDTANFTGDGSGTVDLDGSAFDVGGWVVSGGTNYTFDHGTINFGGDGFVNNSSGVVTLGPDLTGNGAAIFQNGSGVLGVAGSALSLLHDVHLNNGIIRLEDPGQLPVNAHLTFSDGLLFTLQSRTLGDLDPLDGDWMQLAWAAGKEGTIAVGAGATVTIKGAALVFGQNSTVNLGVSGLNGTIEVGGWRSRNLSGGGQKLVIGGGTVKTISGGSGFYEGFSSLTVAEGAVLDLGGAGSAVTISPLAGAGTVQNTDAELVIDGGGATEFSGTLKDISTLTLDNGANLTLTGTRSGAQNVTAGTVVRRGSTLTVDNVGVLGDTPVTVAIGSTLKTIGDLTIDNAVSLFGTTDNTNTLSSAGDTTYTQDLDIWGGGDDNIDDFDGDGGYHNQLEVTGDGDTTFTGAVTDGNLIKSGAGTLTLSGDNDFMIRSQNANTGQHFQKVGTISLEQGKIVVGSNNALRNATVVTSGTADANLELLDGVTNSAGMVIDSQTAQIEVDSGTATQAGVISEAFDTPPLPPAGEGRPLEKIGDGELVLIGQNIFTGPLTVSAGTLSVDNVGGNALADAASVVVMDSATFNVLTNETIAGLAGDGVVTNTGGAATILSLDSDDDLVFDGALTDGSIASLGLTKLGTGTQTLTGANSYTGSTSVLGGTLFVNGDQSAATGLTSVADGATLGGSGIIGGDVTVADGGTLAAGGAAGLAGTLTINGSLALSGGSALDYQLGQAGVAGGTLDDLIEVGGDLTLDGTLTVSATAGGAFGAGVYRLIDYSGELTDNGLDIGTVPGDISDLSVQTSVDGQVNLINTNGSGTFSFWDGAGPGNDGVIEGGAGTWQLAGSLDSWTDAGGATNGAYDNGSFAVFEGAAGTVTVDNGNGVVKASGMQFAANGYEIAGDPLTLAGSDATIRVGDGTGAGAGYAATISAELTGDARLVKTDLGTLVLSGANSYTGGTHIDAGTIRLGTNDALGGGNLDIASDGTFDLARHRLTVTGLTGDAGSIITNSSMTPGVAALTVDLSGGVSNTFAGTIDDGASGNGVYLVKNGAGTLTLGGANSSTASASVAAGTLALAGDGTWAGNVLVDSGATFDITEATDGPSIGQLVDEGEVVLGSNTLTIRMGGAVGGSGEVSGEGGNLTIAGGTLSFYGAGLYTGATTIADGAVLRLAGDGSVAASRSVAVETGGIFDISQMPDGTSVTTIEGGGVIQLGAKTLTLTDASTTFAGTITDGGIVGGTGGGFRLATGTLTLAGANSYTGSTSVEGGTLYVNGDQSAATGLTSVADGATLGGSGTIGGDVTVADGGVLAAGGAAGLAGTLTINGSLALSGGSALDYQLGQAGVAGGTLNDLIEVGGDLTLDGTLNVSATAGGTFGAGVYRLIDYSGELTDNGLDIGTVPGSSVLEVQTSVAGQVNLFNSGGPDQTFSFWDGAGPTNDGIIEGGAGTWQLAGTLDAWTDSTGATNGAYDNGSFAVFEGTGGTVSVDNGNGAVTVSGMQFAADGYTIAGNTLTLIGPDATIRVGDGTPTGAGYTATISAALTGDARLVKTDLGTLVLSGANSYTGGTLVEAGTLVGDVASIRGNLGNAGTVMFDQTADGTFTGAIGGLSGTDGTMIKQGAGMLTLAGTSTLDWSIAAGGLITAADRFAGNVDIGTDASLSFEQSVDAIYAGTLSGAGAFAKTGTGILAYDGDGSGFTGTTTVQQGSLIVGSDTNHEDAVLGGPVDVLSGALLGGYGTVGTVTLASGATIAPGNSIGTLNVAGDITFAAGSTYEVEVDPAGTDSDLIHATGTAHLNGAGVAHLGLDGTYKPSSTYTILTADAGIDGTFGPVTSDFAFLDPTLSYDADSVYLQLTRNDIAFCMAGLTANQCATGAGAESGGSGNPVYDAIVGLSGDQAASAFDQLSGEVHASAKGVLIDDSHFMRDAVNDRIRAAFGAVGADNTPVLAYGEDGNVLAPADTLAPAAWGRAFGAWTDIDGDGNAASLSASTGGFLTGIDAALGENWRAGFVAGYSNTTFHIDDRASSGSSQNWHLGLYGGGQWDVPGGTLGLRGGAAYTWHDIKTSRSVAFPGFSDSLSGDYSAGTAQVFGEVAYDIKAGSLGLEPFANLAYVNLHTDGFTEEGGAAALRSGSSNTDVTFATLGLRASTNFTLGSMTATARGMLGWRHAYGDTTPLSTFAFAGSDPFAIVGLPIAKDAALLEAGLDLILSPDATLGLSYQGQFANHATQNGFNATLNVEF